MDVAFPLRALLVFIIAGMAGGAIGRAYDVYRLYRVGDPVRWGYHIVGLVITGLMGGMMAIIVDRDYRVALAAGLCTDLVYSRLQQYVKAMPILRRDTPSSEGEEK